MKLLRKIIDAYKEAILRFVDAQMKIQNQRWHK